MKLENSSLAFCQSFNSLKALGNYQNLNKTREQRDESSLIKKMRGGGEGGILSADWRVRPFIGNKKYRRTFTY